MRCSEWTYIFEHCERITSVVCVFISQNRPSGHISVVIPRIVLQLVQICFCYYWAPLALKYFNFTIAYCRRTGVGKEIAGVHTLKFIILHVHLRFEKFWHKTSVHIPIVPSSAMLVNCVHQDPTFKNKFVGNYPAESCGYVCFAPLRHYRNSPSRFSFFRSAFLLSDQQELAARSLQFNLQCTDDDNRSYRNVCNMSLISFSLAVIFIVRNKFVLQQLLYVLR